MKGSSPFLTLATLGLLLALGCARLAGAVEGPALRWIDGGSLTVGGQGWSQPAGRFDRLPASAKGKVRGQVYSLGRDSAGIIVEFETDSPELHVRWELGRERIAMPHMAATGVSGLDLYGLIDGAWRWVAVARPKGPKENAAELFTGQQREVRSFRLYLPLYNIVQRLEIGVATDAKISGRPRDTQPPVVVYGTSAVQGGCASRPGMSYPAMLGRRLNLPVLNLGFDGNGKAEPEVAELLGTLSPAIYVIDCLPNLMPAEAPKVETFVATIRAARPSTPILLVENLHYPDAILNVDRRDRYVASNRILRAIYERLSRHDKNLHYLPADNFLGADNDGTVDGSHPTDLGFARIADVVTPAILRLLRSPLGTAPSTPTP